MEKLFCVPLLVDIKEIFVFFFNYFHSGLDNTKVKSNFLADRDILVDEVALEGLYGYRFMGECHDVVRATLALAEPSQTVILRGGRMP